MVANTSEILNKKQKQPFLTFVRYKYNWFKAYENRVLKLFLLKKIR